MDSLFLEMDILEYGVNDKETTQDTRVRWAGINKIGYIIQIQCKEKHLERTEMHGRD